MSVCVRTRENSKSSQNRTKQNATLNATRVENNKKKNNSERLTCQVLHAVPQPHVVHPLQQLTMQGGQVVRFEHFAIGYGRGQQHRLRGAFRRDGRAQTAGKDRGGSGGKGELVERLSCRSLGKRHFSPAKQRENKR